MKETVLVTGADGMLGVDLMEQLRDGPYKPVASTIQSMDIMDKLRVRESLHSIKPDIVIHTAAYTDVDGAETQKELCMAVNHHGTRNIAELCLEIDAQLLYISTDYVFDGSKKTPYLETDQPCPINVYGESKLLGEQAILETGLSSYKICRTSWLHGLHGIRGTNFLEAIFRAAANKEPLRIIRDQVGRPTFTFDLAVLLEKLLSVRENGIFHLTNTGECSWFEFTRSALEMEGIHDVEVIPIPSSEYKTKARRPRNSRLAAPRLEKLGLPLLRNWRDGLQEYILRRRKIKEND